MAYGKELILDLHDTEHAPYCRGYIRVFLRELCRAIDMEAEDLHFWDYEGAPEEYHAAPAHLKGTSAVQFIRTSNVTIHTLDEMRRVYLNVFSCKEFDCAVAKELALRHFGGQIVSCHVIERS